MHEGFRDNGVKNKIFKVLLILNWNEQAMNKKDNISKSISSFTGYTREDWDFHFKRLCYGAFNYRTENKGRIIFPGCNSLYGDKYDSFATISRIIPMISCWLHNTKNPQVINYQGLDMNLEEFVIDAFLSGTREDSPDYWGKMYDRISKIVEVNDLIWSLWLIKDTTLKKFTQREKDRIIRWIDQIYDKTIWENNWQFTPVIVHLIKNKLGYLDNYDIYKNLNCIEKMYRGNGWYSDSTEGETYDYYNAWQIHFGTLIAVLTGEDVIGKDLSIEYIGRTKEYLKIFPYLFGKNGNHLPFGRSLAYKFAVLGTMMLASYMGVSPLDPGLERRIASGSLKFFMENGSVNDKNFLECGYLKEPKEKYEVYMFYGSPYWCSRGFLCLMYDNHDFWTKKELPLPVEEGDFSVEIPAAGFTLIGDHKTGQVQMLNAKNFSLLLKRSEPFYSKFSYSTHFFYNYVMHKGSFPVDSILYCSDTKGNYFKIMRIEEGRNSKNHVYRVMIQGLGNKELVKIKSFIVQLGIYQVRLHEISTLGSSIFIEEGSYPISNISGHTEICSDDTNWAYLTNKKQTVYMQNLLNYDKAIVYKDWQGRSDINLIPEEVVFLSVGRKNPTSGIFYCGCVTVGTPEELMLEKIRHDVPKLSFDKTNKEFLIMDCNDSEYRYTFE